MVALGHGMGYLVRLLAYSLCARSLVLVEGEEVSELLALFFIFLLVVMIVGLFEATK